MEYPPTRRTDIVDRRFGIEVPDPYRWLEGDARDDPEVANWIQAQDEVARSYLASLPSRRYFQRRLTELFDHVRLTAPRKRGRTYFFTRQSGSDEQPVLLAQEGDSGPERVLIDPNGWAGDRATALAEWSVSNDGRFIAYARQEGGTDWRTIHILNVEDGSVLADNVAWARFTTIAWAHDGSGFFYSRFPQPPATKGFETPVTDHAVYFHAIGTQQEGDRLILGTPEGQVLIHTAMVTPDGRYLIIYSSPGAGSNVVSVVDLTDNHWAPRPIVERQGHNWTYAGNQDTRFFLVTDEGAERGRIVAVDLADKDPRVVDVVAESDNRILSDAALLGGRLLVTYAVDTRMEMRRFHLDGSDDGPVDLPGIGTAGGFQGRPDDDEVFFVFTSYNAPTTIYRYAVSKRALEAWATPSVSIDLARIVVEQRFYRSKDGTRIPIAVIRRVDLNSPVATILYGYGGFGISMLPYYRPDVLAWVDAGGAYAVAGIRGGGEYGKAWHNAGRLTSKQKAFDDFIAAAEYLRSESVAAPDGIAIQGESNGGLLVGAVVNQRPDLFAAAMPGVGVMDMLRFTKFTNGRFWMSDFGNPDEEAAFRNLISYSPYHNVRSGARYPAILVTTADTDDRVVPAHSFKYAAALQAADIGERPHLLRVDVRAGHGGGKPLSKIIDEVADLWAFAAAWTSLQLPAENKAGASK